ncbi:MAG: hypothetical protein OQK32_00865 [Gammaproteobacteria bacterium]|nr:hypothetical protein [Gammaproteobacteria bacterium]MCW8923235.1 hypothetical protein [Gammaproteobacteria bacterium]
MNITAPSVRDEIIKPDINQTRHANKIKISPKGFLRVRMYAPIAIRIEAITDVTIEVVDSCE